MIGTAGTDPILVTGSLVRLLAAVVDFRGAGIEQLTVDASGGADVVTVLSSPVGAFVRLLGGPGNDVLTGAAGSEFLSGGEGNDVITGGGGDDIVLGNGGNDTLTALMGSGRSLVIGGGGRDTLIGGGAGSLLIGGNTDYDNNEAALRSIHAVWARRDMSYAQRLLQLRNGGGANGTNVLTAAKVQADQARDILFGSATGQDWYWAAILDFDLTIGRAANELVN